MDIKCGAMSHKIKDADENVQQICDKVKHDVEEKAGKTYDVFTAKSYKTQTVAGSTLVEMITFTSVFGKNSLVMEEMLRAKSHHDSIDYF